MKIKTAIIGGLVGLMGLIGSCSSLYTISETEQAVVTRMGKPVRVIVGSNKAGQVDSALVRELEEWNAKQQSPLEKIEAGSGLYTKTPLVEGIHVFDDRILEYDSAPTDVVTLDKKHLLIDNYARWRIVNPLKFMMSVGTESAAQSRLDDIIYSVIRTYAGSNNLIELVRSTDQELLGAELSTTESITLGREKIMDQITAQCDEKAAEYGIQIVDVRIKRTDLPKENAQSVYSRMIAERSRMAKKYRSEGEEQAIKIRAQADKERTEIHSGAYKEAEKIKGEGDAEALRIYATAYSQDPRFFKLSRTLEAYPAAFGDGTKVVMTQKTEFNKYLAGPSK